MLARIRAIHAQVKGEYGWPRMHKELVARGIRVGKDRVRKLMQQHGIKAKRKRKFVVTTDSRHSLRACPEFCVNGADISLRRCDLQTEW